MDNTEAKKQIIVGLGKTGLSIARYLAARGEEFVVADSRLSPPELSAFTAEFPYVEVLLGEFQLERFVAVERLLVSPGIDLREKAIVAAGENGVEIVGDVELFVRDELISNGSSKIIAITGSNGKTTVTTLMTKVAEAAGYTTVSCGNIGTPVLDLLLQKQYEHVDVFVLELSSFQLESLHSMQADAAVVLNVSDDHLDRYNSSFEYADVKGRIYRNATGVVVNQDDEVAAKLADKYKPHSAKVVNFSLNTSPASLSDLPVIGKHNMANALAVVALAELINIPNTTVMQVLQSWQGLPHRTEQLGVNNAGVRWINDSKATNVGATVAAVEGLAIKNEADIILLAGGLSKDADFSQLREVCQGRVKAAVLFGRDAGQIEQAIAGGGVSSIDIYHANTLDEAVCEHAVSIAKKGDTVLLSPACASFDMFSSFEERGESFKRSVYDCWN